MSSAQKTLELFDGATPHDRKYHSRDTTTGRNFELLIEGALRMAGYQFERQKEIGLRLGVTKHKVDFKVCEGSRIFLVSAKWQGTDGTGENVPMYEVFTLAEALDQNSDFDRAYIVFGGDGMTEAKKDWYISGGYKPQIGRRVFINGSDRVYGISLDTFLTMASRKRL